MADGHGGDVLIARGERAHRCGVHAATLDGARTARHHLDAVERSGVDRGQGHGRHRGTGTERVGPVCAPRDERGVDVLIIHQAHARGVEEVTHIVLVACHLPSRESVAVLVPDGRLVVRGDGVGVCIAVIAVASCIRIARRLRAGHDRRIVIASIAVQVAVEVPGRGIHSAGLVHVSVAVVVHAVADLVGAGVDGRVGVVAVGAMGAVGHAQIAIGVTVETLVRVSVAVVVHAVAVLVGTGVDAGIGVVAVRAVGGVTAGHVALSQGETRITVAVGVGVCVPGGRVQGVVLVEVAVAVRIHAVAVLVRAGVDRGVGVVAVAGRLHEPGRLEAGVDRCAIAIAVAVVVVVPRGLVGHAQIIIVHQAVAVVVHTIADLLDVRVDGGVGVVAVGGVGDVAGGLGAGDDPGPGITEAVGVGVCVPERSIHGIGLVGVAVAVVVHAIADLAGAGVDAGIGVVAVGAVGDVAGRCLAGLGAAGSITVAVRIGVGIEGQHVHGVVLVDVAVAVVVVAVAVLVGAGIDGRVGVVAVGVEDHIA